VVDVTGTDPARWYRDALWAAGADELTTVQLAIGLCYAKFSADGQTAWVVERELMRHCKVRSESTVVKHRGEMVKRGWLSPVGPRESHKQVTVYRLTTPENRCDPRTGSDVDSPQWTGAIREKTGAIRGGKPVRSAVPSQKRLKSPGASGRTSRPTAGASRNAPAKGKPAGGCPLCGGALFKGWRLCEDCAEGKGRCAVCGVAPGPVCGRDACVSVFLRRDRP
jgi:hypothetical protein